MPELPYLHSVKGHQKQRRGYIKSAVVLCIMRDSFYIVLYVSDDIFIPTHKKKIDDYFLFISIYLTNRRCFININCPKTILEPAVLSLICFHLENAAIFSYGSSILEILDYFYLMLLYTC